MRIIVLNPKCNGNNGIKLWQSIESNIPHDKVCVVDEFSKSSFPCAKGDTLIAAGGDGCLHSLVNSCIQQRGLSSLDHMQFGYIGLGSNNSFLQPSKERKKIKSIPVQISEPIFHRDLIEVQISNGNSNLTKYIVSNSSLGFLSFANLTFNTHPVVQILKRLSISAADITSFFLTLAKYRAVKLRIKTSAEDFKSATITNLQWLKSPYFTKDLYFPTDCSMDQGKFDFYSLDGKKSIELLRRFAAMMILGKMQHGYDFHTSLNSMQIESETLTPIEIDGEIYFGDYFKFVTKRGALRVLS